MFELVLKSNKYCFKVYLSSEVRDWTELIILAGWCWPHPASV